MTERSTKSENGWRTFRLDELVVNPKVDIVDGPFGSNLKASEYTDTGVPIARLQNVDPNAFVRKNIRFVSERKAAELSRHNFRSGDLLITKLGDPLGEACIVPPDIERGIIVADLVRVRLDPTRCVREAVCYVINSSVAQSQFKRETKGTTRPRVNLGMVRTLQLPLPEHLDDQNNIVAEIEKQFTRLDAGVALLTRAQTALKRYRASVLKAACEGRLVPTEAELARKENSGYETGEQLLQRILKGRREKWNGKGKYKEADVPNTADLPKVPEGWAWATLDQLCPRFVDSAHRTPKYGAVGVPALGPRDVVNGRLDLANARRVDESEFKIQTARHVPEGGDIVYSRELSLGWGVVLPEGERLCLSQGMCLFRPHDKIDARYFLLMLNGPVGRGHAERAATGSAHPHINLTEIKAYVFPLPPATEQTRIVEDVEQRFSIIEELQALIDVNCNRADKLRRATLQQVFSGGETSSRARRTTATF